MKKTKVRFLGKEKNNYKIKFPRLNIPVVVNKFYFMRMLNSDEYHFVNL